MNLPGIGLTGNREYNVGIIKKLGPNYRLTHLGSVLISGLEERGPKPARYRSSGHERGKLENSISRTKNRIYELAICNPWEFFVTFTLDEKKHDRFDLPTVYSRISKFFNNYNSRYGGDVKYLIVPEPHKNGAWHFHGFVSGLPMSHLKEFSSSDHLPYKMLEYMAQGHKLYNWPAYAERFGFIYLEKIRNHEHCSGYISKYIGKAFTQSEIPLNHQLFHHSQGLKGAEVIYRGVMRRQIEQPDFENDYVRIKNFQRLEDAIPYFCD